MMLTSDELRDIERPTVRTARGLTVEEWRRLPRGYRCELVDGIVLEKGWGDTLHGRTVGRLLRALLEQDVERRVGEVRGGTGWEPRQGAGTGLADLTAARGGGKGGGGGREDRGDEGGTALAVEVTTASPDERDPEAMAGQHLAAGAAEVWWVRPLDNAVAVVRAEGVAARLGRGDTLASGELPGFGLPLEALFGKWGWESRPGGVRRR